MSIPCIIFEFNGIVLFVSFKKFDIYISFWQKDSHIIG